MRIEELERRLAEERNFYNQISLLESELEKQREELLTSKREAGHKLAELSQVCFSCFGCLGRGSFCFDAWTGKQILL